jgi:hypothetical protein
VNYLRIWRNGHHIVARDKLRADTAIALAELGAISLAERWLRRIGDTQHRDAAIAAIACWLLAGDEAEVQQARAWRPWRWMKQAKEVL